jgi:ABC-2 type transport system permease protein
MNWEQLRAIIWLRFRLSRNQFIRAGQLNAVLSIGILAFMLITAGVFTVLGLVLGPVAGAKARPEVLMLVWDGLICAFFFIWLTGLMVELQRSESIDMERLLHLPVSLQQVFVLNFVASHFTPSIILFLPAMIAFSIGLAFGVGPLMALLMPLVISFIFMLSAWTYCLRGWLAALMVNKRRRRAILVWMTVCFVLLGQLPNVLVHSPFFRKQNPKGSSAVHDGKSDSLVSRALIDLHRPVPLGWVGYGAMRLRQGRPWPALEAAAAGCVLGALGLMRAYRLTLRFYTGAENKGAPSAIARAVSPAVKLKPRGGLLVERRLPWLPDDIAGLALATFRSLARAPELKMALAMPLIFGAIGFSMFFSSSKGKLPWAIGEIATPVAVVLTLFFLAPSMANAFGLDRNGFRTLVLIPTRRDHILFAKNLGFFPFVALIALVLVAVVAALTHASWQAILTGLVQIPTSFLLFSLPCNLTSILTPYRLAQGSLKAKRPKAIVLFAVFLSMFIQPIIVAPTLLPIGLQLVFRHNNWLSWLPVSLLGTLVVLVLAAGLYWILLPPLGRLLQRREQTILREVTEEVE